jgi:hypothetical protein
MDRLYGNGECLAKKIARAAGFIGFGRLEFKND